MRWHCQLNFSKRKTNVFPNMIFCLLSTVFLELSHHRHNYFNLSQLWVAPPFPLCNALWDNSIHQQHTHKSSVFIRHFLSIFTIRLTCMWCQAPGSEWSCWWRRTGGWGCPLTSHMETWPRTRCHPQSSGGFLWQRERLRRHNSHKSSVQIYSCKFGKKMLLNTLWW